MTHSNQGAVGHNNPTLGIHSVANLKSGYFNGIYQPDESIHDHGFRKFIRQSIHHMRFFGMATENSDNILFRIDPTRNMQRYYRVTIQPNLFGGHSIIREWGRIDLYENEKTARLALDRTLRSKQNRGYKPTFGNT
jgi:predicted DNA-binding WGR domain protein